MSGRTSINIADNTVYRNVDESDDQFNFLTNATLLLLGYDALNDDALTGAGQLRLRGEVTIDGLSLDDETLVNAAFAVQTGVNSEQVQIGQLASATIRNVVGATWDLVGDASITSAGSGQFVNLGLLEMTTANHVVDDAVIGVDFYDRGGTVDVQDGDLDFTGAVERFVNGAITGGGGVAADDIVLDGTSVSVTDASFNTARIIGDVTVSSASFHCLDLSLSAGGTLALSNSSAALTNVAGAGELAFIGTNSVVGENPEALGFNDLTFEGGVTLVNYGDLDFPSQYLGHGLPNNTINISVQPGVDEQIAIENEPGATLTLEGQIVGPSDGSATLFNYGTLEADGSESYYSFGYPNVSVTFGPFDIGIDVVNNGVMTTATGFSFGGAVTGAGTIEVGQNSFAEGAVGSGQTLEFLPMPASSPGFDYTYSPPYPTLTLDDVQQFAGAINGFDQNGAADDRIVVNSASWAYQDFVPNASGTGGELMFSNGAAQAGVTLVGQYDSLGFHAATSTYSGTTTSTITYSG